MLQITVEQILELIPPYVREVAEKLQQAGFQAYLVGGSLRDVLMDIPPDDFDVATNAQPEQVIQIFAKAIPTGAKFGTITVVCQDEKGESFDVEVTTFRSEADYVGGRWPSKVEFALDIKDDLARRDLTINAMALNLQEFDRPDINKQMLLEELLLDPFGGVIDLQSRLIRAVGDPLERFSEDGLRPVRVCRLAAQLGFSVEEKTFAAVKKTNHITKQISVERFRDELLKLIKKAPQPSQGIKLMQQGGILEIFIPELLEGINVEQPMWHVDDVFTHSLKALDAAEDSIKLAALFHDIAKPRCYSQDERGVHFYGHDVLGGEMTSQIMSRLKFPNAEIDRVSKLVRWHMFYYPSADWRKFKQDDFDYKNATAAEIEAHIMQSANYSTRGGWSDSAIRRLIKNVGGEEAIDQLFKLRIADAAANPKSEFNPHEIDVLARRVAEVRAKEMVIKLADLDISGADLMRELNLPAGRQIGEILEFLLEQVIEEPLHNKKETLLALAKQKISPQT